MIETIIIGLLFVGAVVFLGRKVYLSLKVDKGCAKGCGCSEADIQKALKETAQK
ncbi:MAG: FeoB-associated Cys-rich membrane protein [Imperialibacter sp.]